MSGIFSGCRSLKSLPDISKWNIENVKNIREMFSGLSLESIPDISKWNIKNENVARGFFSRKRKDIYHKFKFLLCHLLLYHLLYFHLYIYNLFFHKNFSNLCQLF